jgi:predicted lipoprotein with Yx(FWY)xxD motif
MHHLSNTRAAILRATTVAAAVAALAALGSLLHSSSSHAAGASSAIISTRTTRLGSILVDSRGKTLYLFEGDRGAASSCTGQCATLWPPLITQGWPRVSGGANRSLIGIVRRSDGRLQVTYNHHPLYEFVADREAGQTNGQEWKQFGGAWYVLSTGGSKVDGDNPASIDGGGK